MKALVLDIETSPIEAYVWGLWENNVSLNQIKEDWRVLSWSAKWLDSKEVLYMDCRDDKDDKRILKQIWKLLDEADVVITQNGVRFDSKKLNARFLHHKMQPPSSYRHIDTFKIAKKHFAFTSNKLEYMTDKFCVKYKKLSHKKFPGFELWKECLNGNKAAWNEMKKYNQHDVLSLEELYHVLRAWDNGGVNVNQEECACSCGSKQFKKRGFFFTNVGKYQRYKCLKCGKETRDRKTFKEVA